MRTNTKIKQLLKDHTLSLSLNSRGGIDIIVTNNHTGNSHLSSGASLSVATGRAFADTQKINKLEKK